MTYAQRETICINRLDEEAPWRFLCPNLFALRDILEVTPGADTQVLGGVEAAIDTLMRFGTGTPVALIIDIEDVSAEAFERLYNERRQAA